MGKKYVKDLFSEKGFQRNISKVTFKLNSKKYAEGEADGNGGSAKYAHVTYCTAPNAGDTVLSQCVRKTIEQKTKLSKWKIIPVKAQVTGDTVSAINGCDKLIIGGGGLFLPDTNSNSVSGWQWAVSKEQLDKITVPISVFSVGYNYFRGQKVNTLFEESLIKLMEKSSFCGLRNMGSVKAVKSMIPEELREKIVYQPCTTTLIRKLYSDTLPTKKETGSVAVNMAFDRANLRYGSNMDQILSQCAEAIKEISKKGYDINYVCHCWDDDKFLKYLKSCGVKYKLVDLSRKFPSDVYDFYNGMDLVLGMRGHAQMIPFGIGCEIISLGTHDKMKWFLEDLNAQDWYVDLVKDVSSLKTRIVDTFTSVHETNREDTKSRIISAQDRLWDITMNNLSIM